MSQITINAKAISNHAGKNASPTNSLCRELSGFPGDEIPWAGVVGASAPTERVKNQNLILV
jgi:hypothetical protein